MCDVPSIAIYCSESIEFFSGTVSKFFLKILVTIPVIITGTIVHFRFYIRCISIHTNLYFNFFSASFCTTFLSAGIIIIIKITSSSPKRPHWLWGPPNLLFSGYKSSFLGLNRPEHDVDRSCPSTAEVMNGVIPPLPLYVFMAWTGTSSPSYLFHLYFDVK